MVLFSHLDTNIFCYMHITTFILILILQAFIHCVFDQYFVACGNRITVRGEDILGFSAELNIKVLLMVNYLTRLETRKCFIHN